MGFYIDYVLVCPRCLRSAFKCSCSWHDLEVWGHCGFVPLAFALALRAGYRGPL